MTPADQYKLLVDSLQLVAASAEEQVSALPDFVCVADEVASTFGDAFLLVPQLKRAGLVSTSAVTALSRLDELFESMLRIEGLADPEVLKTHAYWAEARHLAVEALSSLGEEKRPPDLSYINWVQG